jgi:hypothetical protein
VFKKQKMREQTKEDLSSAGRLNPIVDSRAVLGV